MMKNRSQLIISILLICIAGYFFFTRGKSTLRGDYDRINLENPQQLDSIVIVRDRDTIILTRLGNVWSVNHRYVARVNSVSVLVRSFMDLKIKSPAKGKMKELAVASVSRRHIRLWFYAGTRPLKEYLIGTEPSYTSCIMTDTKDIPVYAEIPGVTAELSAVLPLSADFWRDKVIFACAPYQIKEIVMHFPENSERSFRIENCGKGNFRIRDAKGSIVTDPDPVPLEKYLLSFARVEFVRSLRDPALLAELGKQIPDCELKLTNVNGIATDLKLIPVKNDKGQTDPDNLYAVMNGNEVLLCKYVSLDPLLKELSWFMHKK